ncbi:acetyl-CoA carboxylase biotin carboxyl carrier protein [Proteinivorax tanatarense]|uniref:Biotin carboxyl carrier protein of acetyl-CoA carboxylase n=1 Tax=Proteinivorax tanatarense TaxID=1260629 RepID=A0AAU7VIZ5_9FIRM
MNVKEITELIKVMNKSNLTKLEIQENAISIKMEKQGGKVVLDKTEQVEAMPKVEENPQPKVEEKVSQPSAKEEHDDGNTLIVTSPIVGTFYEAPAPDKPPYVQVGSNVAVGDTLCIVEAMKIMNEIDSEVCGKVVEVLVNDGEMVEYGQELFKIAKQ